MGALRTKSEQTAERVSRIGAETEELERDHQSRAGALAEARARLQEGIEAMAEFETARVELEQEREELRQNLSFKRSQAQTDRDGAQEVAIKVESKRSALQSISAGLERLRHQLEQLQQRRDELTRQLADGDAPLQALATTLEEALQKRVQVEQELAGARTAVETQASEKNQVPGEGTAISIRALANERFIEPLGGIGHQTSVARVSISEVFEGQCDAELSLPQGADDLLQVILLGAGNANLPILKGRLHLQSQRFYRLGDLLCFVAVQTLLNGELLSRVAQGERCRDLFAQHYASQCRAWPAC